MNDLDSVIGSCMGTYMVAMLLAAIPLSQERFKKSTSLDRGGLEDNCHIKKGGQLPYKKRAVQEKRCID